MIGAGTMELIMNGRANTVALFKAGKLFTVTCILPTTIIEPCFY